MFTSACPILPSSDFESTKTFYGTLGFGVTSEYSEQGYLILARDEAELHFFRYSQHIAEESDHGVYLRVQDANALSTEYEELNLPKEGFPSFGKAEDRPWGVCELTVIDTDGNLLRIGHFLES